MQLQEIICIILWSIIFSISKKKCLWWVFVKHFNVCPDICVVKNTFSLLQHNMPLNMVWMG